jgi:hypothetical protein
MWVVEDFEIAGAWGFEIITGKFAGIVVQIKDMNLDEEKNAIPAEFYIIRQPEDISEEAMKSEEFNQLLSEIFLEIFQKIIDENRETNTEELDSQ